MSNTDAVWDLYEDGKYAIDTLINHPSKIIPRFSSFVVKTISKFTTETFESCRKLKYNEMAVLLTAGGIPLAIGAYLGTGAFFLNLPWAFGTLYLIGKVFKPSKPAPSYQGETTLSNPHFRKYVVAKYKGNSLTDLKAFIVKELKSKNLPTLGYSNMFNSLKSVK